MSKLYRGYKGDSPLRCGRVLWLSDSKLYAGIHGDKVAEFEIEDNKVDCPIPKDLYRLIEISPLIDYEEYWDRIYHPSDEFLDRLTAEGYNSYAFTDDEYHCVNLALLDKSIVTLKNKTMSKHLVYLSDIKCFATYGGGPHHVVVAHKDNSGKWRAEVIEEEYQAAKEAFMNTDPKKETYKVYKLD